MLNRIKEKFAQMAEEARKRQEDIALQFDDPIAQETEWSPLKRGGSNFKSQQIIQTPSGQLRVTKSRGGTFFYGIFAVIGYGVLIAAFGSYFGFFGPEGLMFPPGYTEELIGISVFGSIFALVGTFLMFENKNLTFDKTQGYCWRGKKSPRDVIRAEEISKLIPLDRIKGLQIIRERVSSSDNSYYSYELNMILNDKSRVNVMDHGSLDSLRDDAHKLSEYLDVPLFDAC